MKNPFTLLSIVYAVILILTIAFWIGVALTAWHFIAKLW
jgi:hypothetical protein